METIELTNAAEYDIVVIEGDKLEDPRSTIAIFNSDGSLHDMTVYSSVELDIYRDKNFQSKIYSFKTSDSTLLLGNGFFTLVADPFTLSKETYRYGLRELDSPATLAFGHFIVKRKF